MSDMQYKEVNYNISMQEHKYGDNIHLLSNPILMTQLAKLCFKTTIQPQVNELITFIYRSMTAILINHRFPRINVKKETRMIDYNKEAIFEGQIIDTEHKVVLVDLARAGMLPSLVCYQYLNNFLNPEGVRLDHIFINRKINEKEEVIGTNLSGHKIGGGVDKSFVIFPDPMGATGISICNAVDVYKKQIAGTPDMMVAVHLIITPEYIKKVSQEHPDLQVYAIRLDRGLSSPEVLKTIPGTHPEQEKGLNEKQYIVPGAGGLGEVINNSYI
ncbi:MAG: uracil phosphoribosyltransferase [Pseudomonadota bacterium]